MILLNDLSRQSGEMTRALDQAITRVVRSGRFVLGKEVAAFETEFAQYVGTSFCVSVANGTDALELALRALGVRHNSKVITVANAGMYSTSAITAVGAQPLYAEVQPNNSLIDHQDVARLIGEDAIAAIIVTHLYGLMADMEQILALARPRSIPIIEDCAQAHGALLNGRRAGSFGELACFSFYPTKNLGAFGDGGAILSDDSALADRIRQLRQYGWDTKYHASLAGGRNSRLDEIQAAILRIKLPQLDEWNRRRRNIAAEYSRRIRHPRIRVPALHGEEYVAHLYVIATAQRDDLMRHLANNGVRSEIHYPIPDYRQPCYRDLFPAVSRPVTDRLCDEVLTLPCFPEMTGAEIDTVIDCTNNW